jgi:hypothetical protein
MGKKLDRKANLAKRLALWSIHDQINHEAVDKEVIRFSQKNKDLSDELSQIEKDLKELLKKRREIANKLIDSCKENILVLEDQTQNSVAKPLVDLAFWERCYA